MSTVNSKRLKQIEILANQLFVTKDVSFQPIVYNLPIFLDLAKLLYSNLPHFENDEGLNFDKNALTKKTPLENLNIIKEFYKKYNIDLDIDKLICDGTIETFLCEKEYSSYGKNYYKNGKKLIDSCNNELLIDSIVMVHELSHYRNQPNYMRSIANDLLTEAVAVIDELIFMDYLKEIGYEFDVATFFKYHFNIATFISKNVLPVYKMAILYEKLSSLSRDSYKFYYGTDEYYEDDINDVDEYLKNKRDFLVDSWYILAYTLASYMYFKYKQNPDFLDTISSLHTKMNTEDFLDCLMGINLDGFTNEDMEKITESILFIKNKLEEQENKLILKPKNS